MEAANGQARAPAPFLRKTWDLVEDAQSDSIVGWTAEGASFVVSRPAELASDILPKYFKHNNFSSFVRQLNTYGFRKVDPDRWEFSNECFQRGRRDLLGSIVRRKPAAATAGRGSGGNGAEDMAELDAAHGDALRYGGTGSPQQQPGLQQQPAHQQQQQWNGGPPSRQPSGFTSPRGDGTSGYGMDRPMYRSNSGNNHDLPAPRPSFVDQQQGQPGDHRSAFRRPSGSITHMRGGSSEDPSPPLQGGAAADPHSSGGSGATNVNGGAFTTPFAFGSGQLPPPQPSGQVGGQPQGRKEDKGSHLQRLADHAHTLQQRGHPDTSMLARPSADSGSTQPSGATTPGGTGGSAPHLGGSCDSAGGGQMDSEEQGGAKKRKFRGVRQGLPAPDMLGDKEGSGNEHTNSGGLNSNRSGGNSDVSRPMPVNFADMAAQMSRMSQLAIDVENLKMRNALLESELLRTRQTDWQDRATLEARMAASEDYRAQAEARNRLEDTWKAGQEAAMFRWRAEQHAMQQGEVAWKSMNDARFGDLVRQYAARNNAEDAWKAQSEARMKAGEDWQIATETREAIREQERRSGSQDQSGSAERPHLQGLSRGNSAGPSASNDTQGSGGQSGGAGAMAAPGAPGGAAINSGSAGGGSGLGAAGSDGGSGGGSRGAVGNTVGTGGGSNDRSRGSYDEAQHAAQLQKIMQMRAMHDLPAGGRSNGSNDLGSLAPSSATDERARAEIDRMQQQSDAMEVRMRASEAVAAAQVQQTRDIAARFSEQSAKNQHDSRRDHHFEQRLMLQERHVQNQADANTKLQEQVLELTRQLALEREARVASDDARRSASDGNAPSSSHDRAPGRSGSAQSGSVLSGSDPHVGSNRAPGLEAQSGGSRDSGRGRPGLPPHAPPPRTSPKHPAAQQAAQQKTQPNQAMPAESEQQASRMSIDEQGAHAYNKREGEAGQLRMQSATFSSAPARLPGSSGNSG